MTLNDLGEGLRAIADEVQPVDMRDRVHAASRRLRARRITATTTAAAAALLVTVAGAAVVSSGWPGGQQTASPAAPPLPAPTTVSTTVDDLAGTFYFADVEFAEYAPGTSSSGAGPSSGSADAIPVEDQVTLWSWREGGEPVALAQGLPITGGTLSPDGRFYAYYDGGEARLRNLTDGAVYRIGYSPQGDDALCPPPLAWAPDAYRLLVRLDGTDGFYDITTTEFTPVEPVTGCGVKVAADANGGDLLVSMDPGDGTPTADPALVTATPDGTEVGMFAWDLVAESVMSSVFSVAPNAGYACVDTYLEPVTPDEVLWNLPSDYCTTILSLTDPEEQITLPGTSEKDEYFVTQALTFDDSYIANGMDENGGRALTWDSYEGKGLGTVPVPEFGSDPQLALYVP